MTNNIKKPEQETENPPLHPVARILLWAFIIINAYVILFGLIPAIISISILRHLAIPTPWHFHGGYGTPLGLTLAPAIVLSIVPALLIVLCVWVLKPIAMKASRWSDFFILIVILAIGCAGLMVFISESPEDYLRGALLQDVPENVAVDVSQGGRHGGSGTFPSIMIYATPDEIPIEEFESFVLEMQALTFRVLQRRNIDRYGFTISLRIQTDDGQRYLVWAPLRSALPHGYGEWTPLPEGEYGRLYATGLFSNLYDMATRGFAFGLWDGLHVLPITNIQETVDGLILADSFAFELGKEMPSRVYIVRTFDDSNIPTITGLAYDKVDVWITHDENSFPLSMDDVENSLMEIDEHVRSIAKSHNLEVYRLRIFLVPYEPGPFVVWTAVEGENYGTLTISGPPGHTFENIHISEVQGFIDSLSD